MDYYGANVNTFTKTKRFCFCHESYIDGYGEEAPVNYEQETRRIKLLFDELYDEYNNRFGTVDYSVPGTSSGTSTKKGGFKGIMKAIGKIGNKKQRSSQSSPDGGSRETAMYMRTSFEISQTGEYSFNFDILKWWKVHSAEYPILAAMAIEFLTCPVSTVSVERSFSIGGNMLSSRRSSIHPNNMEFQMCINDWVRADMRNQEEESDSDNPFEVLDYTDTTNSRAGTSGANTDNDYLDEDDNYTNMHEDDD